jgi:hypothetical protein
MRLYVLLGSSCALLSSLVLGGCNGLLGDSPDVDYAIIVPVVTQCYQPGTETENARFANAIMEVGFTKVRAACETFFVDATRFQQNALATSGTLDALLIGANSIITATSSGPSAVKALAVTAAGIVLGKTVVNQFSTIYAFGTHLQKIRHLAYADMDEFTDRSRTTAQPANACRAYSLVQELALKCTLAALKDIENQQFSIPSGPVVAVTAITPLTPVSRRLAVTPAASSGVRFIERRNPSVGVTIMPY